jgi:ABC-2 type transport system ATP-binding protein
VTVLARVLDEMGLEYSVVDDSHADIYAQISISKLTFALAEENCELISIHEHDESLESYFINLVGGESND